jgi:hypothetical protein
MFVRFLAVLFTVLVLFFAVPFPANQATANWTQLAADWEVLRRHWEWSHALNAVLTFASFCCTLAASLTLPTTND